MCLHTRSTWKPACLLFTIPAFPSTRAETRTGVFLSPAYSQEVLVGRCWPLRPLYYIWRTFSFMDAVCSSMVVP